jgi:hypothetical protein
MCFADHHQDSTESIFYEGIISTVRTYLKAIAALQMNMLIVYFLLGLLYCEHAILIVHFLKWMVLNGF